MGRSTELSEEEEELTVERVLLMGTWGFPLNNRDLGQLIKDYLDRQGRTTRNVSIINKFYMILVIMYPTSIGI